MRRTPRRATSPATESTDSDTRLRARHDRSTRSHRSARHRRATVTEPPVSINPDGTVTVTHDYGTFDIPLQPTACSPSRTGVISRPPWCSTSPFPASVCSAARPRTSPHHSSVDLDGVEIVDNSELNLEQIAAMDPDLVPRPQHVPRRRTSRAAGHDRSHPADRCRRVVAGDDLEQVAGLMQRTELLDGALAEYDAAVADVDDRHADALASTPVAIVEYYPADQTFYAGGVDDFPLQANTLGELGGELVPFLADRSYFDQPFSIENLNEISNARDPAGVQLAGRHRCPGCRTRSGRRSLRYRQDGS